MHDRADPELDEQLRYDAERDIDWSPRQPRPVFAALRRDTIAVAEALETLRPWLERANVARGDILATGSRIGLVREDVWPRRDGSYGVLSLDSLLKTDSDVNAALFPDTARAQRNLRNARLRDDNRKIWRLAGHAGPGLHRAKREQIDDGALGSGEPYELDAGPDDAFRARSGIPNLSRDRHVDGRTELQAHRNTTAQMQPELTVVPHAEKFHWVGVAQVDPHAERRDVDDCALSPQIRRFVLDMAKTHPESRLAFYPSAILHGLSSQ